jgi:hypothetical protein
VFTAQYGLSTYIQMIRLVFINEVKCIYSAVCLGPYIHQIRLAF